MVRSWAIASTPPRCEETPLLNHRITYLPLLNAANRPAINQGDVFMNQDLFTTNGAGRRQTWFEVDGATGNDSWGRQTIFSNIPLDAVQEMTVLTNAFSAEYGGSTGSVINIVTKSGGNQFHGDVLELWRPAATEAALAGFTSANAASGNDITNDTLGQSGAGALRAHRIGRPHAFLRGRRIQPRRPRFADHFAARARQLRRPLSRLARHSCASITSSTTRTTSSSAAMLDGFHDTNPNGIVGGNSLPTVERVFRRRTYSEELGETAVLSARRC